MASEEIQKYLVSRVFKSKAKDSRPFLDTNGQTDTKKTLNAERVQ